MKKLAVAAVFFTLALACGKRGDPKPPVPVIPQATSDLLVTQRADQVILSWSYPALTTAGKSLSGVRRISIYRYDEDLPVSALQPEGDAVATTAIETDLPRQVALFSRIPVIPQAQFAKLGTRIESIEGANLGTATEGSKLIFSDSPPFTTSDGRPMRLTYAVVTEAETARGEFSNLATIIPLPVAVPPVGVTATAKPEGVVVSWNRPEQAITRTDAPALVGYYVYRLQPGQPLEEFPVPVSSALVKETTWTDNPPYGEHEYRVSAVAFPGPPLIQSALSAPAAVTFRDLVPPPTPTGLTTLVEPSLVRLVWEPVSAPDLRGYNIYRTEAPHRLKLNPQPATVTNFMDISVEVGVSYFYEITSVDTTGNESTPAKSEIVIVPKTP